MDVFMDAFLNIMAILAMIAAGGVLFYFIGSLILSFIKPKEEKTAEEQKEA